MAELFTTTKLFRNPGKEPANAIDDLQGLIVGLYFSAHWCQPCRQFTPQLRQFYQRANAGGGGKCWEVVFISQDKTEAEMGEYLKEHGEWLFLGHGDILAKELKVKYGILGLPSLVIVRQNGKIISLEGAEEVQNCFAILDEKKADELAANWGIK